MIPEALVSSKSQDWATPWHVFEAMGAVYPYDIDLAASGTSKKCEKYLGLDKGDDSLQVPWHTLGRCGWLNPPYGDKRYPVKSWAKRAFNEAKLGFTCTMLLPINKMDQPWFHDLAIGKAEILVVRGRIQFLDPVTQKPSKHGNSQGSMFITWGPQVTPRIGSVSFQTTTKKAKKADP